MDESSPLRSWLALAAAGGLGPVLAKRLLETYKTPAAILALDAETLASRGLSQAAVSALRQPDETKIRSALDWLERADHHLITLQDPDYPVLLREITSAPVCFFAAGRREIIETVQFAIVGSRNPSHAGRRLAEEFARDLALSGLTICSGLALGVDYHSHLGALKAERPTVAVLGNGLARIYPARHRAVAAEITRQGLLVSEFFPDVAPRPAHFPQRNRLISGLSTGVLVVEAARKSGSLITAHYGLEQGREVFAIPGSIHNPLARGAHSLIKQGAKLVECTADIFEELEPLVGAAARRAPAAALPAHKDGQLEPAYKRLFELMAYEEVSVNELVELSGLTADTVSSMLLILELDGVVESGNTGKYRRCS